MYWKTAITFCQHEFSGKIRYDKIFKEVTHIGGESVMNYINIFQNVKAVSVSIGNIYSENQLMHTFLDNFHQGENIQLK